MFVTLTQLYKLYFQFYHCKNIFEAKSFQSSIYRHFHRPKLFKYFSYFVFIHILIRNSLLIDIFSAPINPKPRLQEKKCIQKTTSVKYIQSSNFSTGRVKSPESCVI